MTNPFELSAFDVNEKIELQAKFAWHRAVAGLNLPGYDWRLESIGDALCSISTSDHSILMNRVIGLGSRTDPTIEQLVEIRELYRRAGISRFFLHVMPELSGPGMEQLLADAGFQRYRGWMIFTRGTDAPPETSTDLAVRRVGPGEAADFAAISAAAFDMQAVSEPAIAVLANTPGWHLFMSFDGDRPAGTGAVYMKDGVAHTDWGATHPDFRRRGSQTALLNTRIRFALEAGCSTIMTMTGEAVPGDPQHSYNNILRGGFIEAYLRENWVPIDS